jgi:thioredoxin-like negative regulator of GroEL
MKPILRKLAEERMVTVVEIDLDVHKDLADTHNVQSIPLIKYVVDSGARVAWTSIGIVTRDEIVSHVS